MWHIEEEEPMDTSELPCLWYYLADCGRWHSFEDDGDNALTSEHIEMCYLRDPKAGLDTCPFDGSSWIDFSAMLETNRITGRQRRIHRGAKIQRSCCCCFTAAPVFWEMVDHTRPYQLIPLKEVSPEYQTVEAYVKNDGLLDRSIVSIYRIQNLDLWEFYCRKKKHLKRLHGVTEIPERRLFHGTKVKNVDSICKYNFDIRRAGRHGHVFGKGIYFAKHAAYADKYSDSRVDPLHPRGDRTKVMFLARVMIGEPIAGQPCFQKPDHGCFENIHDSCVDDIKDPKVFVVFDGNQIYPEYLIQYRE